MLIAVLFISAKTWKKPSCPSIGEQIKITACLDNGIPSGAKKKWAIKPQKGMEQS